MLAKRHTPEQIVKLSPWGLDAGRGEDGHRDGSSLRDHRYHLVSLKERLWRVEDTGREETQGAQDREPQV